MPLRSAQPPAESRAAARDGIQQLAQAGRFNTPDRPEVVGDDLELRSPHQVFVLGLRDLIEAEGLQAARPVGWRFVVEHQERPVALADTFLDEAGRHVLGQVNYGHFVAGTAQAFEVARTSSGPGDVADVELLQVPALHLLMLRISHGDSSPELIPIAPTPSGIEANRVYAADELVGVLTERARAQSEYGEREGT